MIEGRLILRICQRDTGEAHICLHTAPIVFDGGFVRTACLDCRTKMPEGMAVPPEHIRIGRCNGICMRKLFERGIVPALRHIDITHRQKDFDVVLEAMCRALDFVRYRCNRGLFGSDFGFELGKLTVVLGFVATELDCTPICLERRRAIATLLIQLPQFVVPAGVFGVAQECLFEVGNRFVDAPLQNQQMGQCIEVWCRQDQAPWH